MLKFGGKFVVLGNFFANEVNMAKIGKRGVMHIKQSHLFFQVEMANGSALEPCLMEAFCRISNTSEPVKSYNYSIASFSSQVWNRYGHYQVSK